MTAFTVWKFETPEGAEQAAHRLHKIASGDHDIIKIVDHAVVSWPVGARRPTTEHGHDDIKSGTGWGAFWGILFGAVFFVPLLGAAAGAAVGAIAKATQQVGITKDQIDRIREEITEGTSALFLVTEQGNLDRLGERFDSSHMKLIETNLTDGEVRILNETFGSR